MFCPTCGNADQQPETFCRQCGIFLPDFDKLKRKEIPPEDHLRANSVLSLMSAIVSGTLAILLHLFFTLRTEGTPPLILIYLTAGFLTAMFFWQAQTFWRTRQLKKHFPKRKKEAQVKPVAPDTNQLFASAQTKELLNEADFSDAVPLSVIENTTTRLGEKVQRKSS
jgi:hypothetical protein